MRHKLSLLVMVGVMVFLMSGCNRFLVGPTETETRTIELGKAETVQANIEMGIGELNLSGGASNLLDAEFTYNVAEWKPEVTYEVSGSRGRLNVKQPAYEFEGIPDDDVEYTWNLSLSNEVPLNLDIDLGVGESNIDLAGLNLTELDVTTGVGQSTIDLSGDWDEGFDVRIKGGVGDTTIILPREVGVFVELNTGIADVEVFGLVREGDNYRNDVYDQSDVTINVEVDGGIGQIELRLSE
ncbi:MAG: hypothetical protein KC413_18030 [Anaerolineales bacterium]|nr:hypothetical protein [Anaerolineales bacterium]MCA9977666.1 hypothetical protein [Anaerolineales bacterium]